VRKNIYRTSWKGEGYWLHPTNCNAGRLHNLYYYTWIQKCAYLATSALVRAAIDCNRLQWTATDCNSLQHTATHCSMSWIYVYLATFGLIWAAIDYHRLQQNATHCNTLQHTAAHLYIYAYLAASALVWDSCGKRFKRSISKNSQAYMWIHKYIHKCRCMHICRKLCMYIHPYIYVCKYICICIYV